MNTTILFHANICSLIDSDYYIHELEYYYFKAGTVEIFQNSQVIVCVNQYQLNWNCLYLIFFSQFRLIFLPQGDFSYKYGIKKLRK